MKTKNKMSIRNWIQQNKISPRLANVLKHYEFAFNCKDINQVNPAELIRFRNAGEKTIEEFIKCRNRLPAEPGIIKKSPGQGQIKMKTIPKTKREFRLRLEALAKDVLQSEGKIPFTSQMVRNKCVELRRQARVLLNIAKDGLQENKKDAGFVPSCSPTCYF